MHDDTIHLWTAVLYSTFAVAGDESITCRDRLISDRHSMFKACKNAKIVSA